MSEVNVRAHTRRTKTGRVAQVRQTQRTVDTHSLVSAIAKQMARATTGAPVPGGNQPARSMQSAGVPQDPAVAVPPAAMPSPAPTPAAGKAAAAPLNHGALTAALTKHAPGGPDHAGLQDALARAIAQHHEAGGRVKHIRYENGAWRTSNTKPQAVDGQPLLHVASGQVKVSVGGQVVHAEPMAKPAAADTTSAAPDAAPGAPKALKDAAQKPADPAAKAPKRAPEKAPPTPAIAPEPAVPAGVHLDGKHEPHTEPTPSLITPDPVVPTEPHTTGGGLKKQPVVHPVGPVNEPVKAIATPSIDIHAPIAALPAALFEGKSEAHAARIRRYEAAKQHLDKVAEKKQLESQLFSADGPGKANIKTQLQGYVAYTPDVELKIRQSLHSAMRPMLHGIAADYIRKLGLTPTLDAKGRPEASSFYGDLSQAAMEHAWEVVRRHDPATHKTALEDQVRGTVTKELSQRWRNVLGLTSVNVTPTEHRNLRQMAKVRAALADQLGRAPHDGEVADAMGIKERDVEHLRDLASAVAASRLDAKVNEDEGSATLGDTIASGAPSPERLLLREEAENTVRDQVAGAIGRIEDPRIRHALVLDAGIEDGHASLIAMAKHLEIPQLAQALKAEIRKDVAKGVTSTADELATRALVATGTRAIKVNANGARYKLALKLIAYKLDPVKLLTTPEPGKDQLTPTDLFQRLGYDEGFGRKMLMHGRNALKADQGLARFAQRDMAKGWTAAIVWSPEQRLYRAAFFGEPQQPAPDRIVKAWLASAPLVKSMHGADNVYTVIDPVFGFAWQMAAFDVDPLTKSDSHVESHMSHSKHGVAFQVRDHMRHVDRKALIEAIASHMAHPGVEHHEITVGDTTAHVLVRHEGEGEDKKIKLHAVLDESGAAVDVSHRGQTSFNKLYEHLGFSQKSEGGKAVSHNMAKQFAIAHKSGDVSAKVNEQIQRLGTNKQVREKDGKVLTSTLTGAAKKDHAARNAPIAFVDADAAAHAEHEATRQALGARVDTDSRAMLNRFADMQAANEAHASAVAAHGPDTSETQHTREQAVAAAANFKDAHAQLQESEQALANHEAQGPAGDRTFTATMHGGQALDIHVGADGRVTDGGYWGELLGNTLIHSAEDLNRKLKSLEGHESKVHLSNGGNHWLLSVRYDGKGTPVITGGPLKGQRLHEVIGQNGGLKSTQGPIEHNGKRLFPGYDRAEGRNTALGNWSKEKAYEHFEASTPDEKAEVDRKIAEADAGAGPEMATVTPEKESDGDALLTLPGDPADLGLAQKLVARYGNLKTVTGKHLDAIAAEHADALGDRDGVDKAAHIHELLKVARVLYSLKEEGYGDLVDGPGGRQAIRLPISAIDHVTSLLGGLKLRGAAMSRLQQHRQAQVEAADRINSFEQLGAQAYGPTGRAANAIPGMLTHKGGTPEGDPIGFTKHQQKAIHQYITTKRMISALGVGNGKTSSAMAAAEYAMVHDNEAPKRYVVVVPTQAQASAWRDDAKNFFGLTAHDPTTPETHDPDGQMSFGANVGPNSRYHVVTRNMIADSRTRVGGRKLSELLKDEGMKPADLADAGKRAGLAAKHGLDPAELVRADGRPAPGGRMVGTKSLPQYLKEQGFDGMIVDEAHSVNSASLESGVQRRAVDAYIHGMAHPETGLTAEHGKVKGVMALTGTPIQNHPGEQYNLVQLTHRGEHDLGTQKHFLDTYMRKDPRSGQYVGVRKDKAEELGNKLARYMVTSTNEDLNAERRPPSASLQEATVHLGPEHDAMLRRHDKLMRETGVGNLVGASDKKSKGGALAAISQIEDEMHDLKVAHAETVMRGILDSDPHAKIILASRRVSGQDKLQAMVKRVLGEYEGRAAAHLAGAFDSIHAQIHNELEKHQKTRTTIEAEHAATREAHTMVQGIVERRAGQGGSLSMEDQAALAEHEPAARRHAELADRLSQFPTEPSTVRELRRSAERIHQTIGGADAHRLGYQYGSIRSNENDEFGKKVPISQAERQEAVRNFNDDESHKALVISAPIASSGVNLGRGTHLLDLDGDYNQGNLEQLYGRHARLTGSVPLAIVHPIVTRSATAGVPTLDERKQDAVTRKRDVATEVRNAARAGRVPDVAANPVRIKPQHMGVARTTKGEA